MIRMTGSHRHFHGVTMPSRQPPISLMLLCMLVIFAPLLAAVLHGLGSELLFSADNAPTWLVPTLLVGFLLIPLAGVVVCARKLSNAQVHTMMRWQIICLAIALLGGIVQSQLTYRGYSMDHRETPGFPHFLMTISSLASILCVLAITCLGIAGMGLLLRRRHFKAGLQLCVIGIMAMWWMSHVRPDLAHEDEAAAGSAAAITQPSDDM